MAGVRNQSLSVVIPNGAAVSAPLSMETFSKGLFHMPSAWTAASMGFQVSQTVGGTYQALSDDSGVIALTVAADGSYLIPTNIMAARYIKFWSHTAGSDTNQGAERTIGVDLKT
jgi:hypothetical protein